MGCWTIPEVVSLVNRHGGARSALPNETALAGNDLGERILERALVIDGHVDLAESAALGHAAEDLLGDLGEQACG